ncbi:hypothetical protein [Legionella fallonii]|uniref:Uncharacterized protein n=1 Tax=Legionella fallonii LLAP-10 TaxID=1212491 RepID=A0A098G9E9_9GAMM|nr:hypothetical protein [Legionella fallonii]CEG59093.1 conserved protein of unknown function [Legionella fallonii LLAP-10]
MSEKIQHTAAGLREKMLSRYNDGREHKHNKSHLSYRQHWKSHPCTQRDGKDEESVFDGSTGLLRQFKLRKMRKRLDKGRIH